jgi:hypothetical protein
VTSDEKIFSNNFPFTFIKKRTDGNDHGSKPFSRNLIARLLEELYIEKGHFTEHHIPLPIGYSSDHYTQQFLRGIEGFSWKNQYDIPVRLEEWNAFSYHLGEAGFRFGLDITAFDNANTSKNIIAKIDDNLYSQGKIGKYWMVVDFGSHGGIYGRVRYKIEDFISDNQKELRETLGHNYKLLELATLNLLDHEFTNDQELLYLSLARDYVEEEIFNHPALISKFA